MKNKLFNTIQIKAPKRNAFDLSHESKLTTNFGVLTPILMQEYMPGDSFRMSSEALVRMAPLTAPVMHRANVYMHFFKVPYRLVHQNWEDFITGGEHGDSAATIPTVRCDLMTWTRFKNGSLADYMGLPVPENAPAENGAMNVSALPFRAYQLIYNEYYRDQNLQEKVAFTKNDTANDAEQAEILQIRNRAWEKDYFTSCLPEAQKGAPVNIPTTFNYKKPSEVKKSSDGTQFIGPENLEANNGVLVSATSDTPLYLDNYESLGITINDLRKSARLQEWLEKNMRGGTRYIEQILSHFGVQSSNKLLQRPEFIGGGKLPIVISEVLSTFNNAEVPGANMYGHGIAAGSTLGFNTFCEEHGVILGIMSILPRTAYQNGIPKEWQKFDNLDYAWPSFANIGEQEVLNREVYHNFESVSNDNNETFGYQSRYAEYKFRNSTVHGDFRDKLDFWHMGRKFDAMPALNTDFIECLTDDRIFSVTDPTVQKIYVQIYKNIQALRPLPVYGTPML